MKTTPTVNCRQVRHRERIEAHIRRRVAGLDKFYPSLIGARVTVSPAARHRRDGHQFHIGIELAVPGETLVISRDATLHAGAHNDMGDAAWTTEHPDATDKELLAAIREAFAVARRRLQDYGRRQHRRVKRHSQPASRLLPRGANG